MMSDVYCKAESRTITTIPSAKYTLRTIILSRGQPRGFPHRGGFLGHLDLAVRASPCARPYACCPQTIGTGCFPHAQDAGGHWPRVQASRDRAKRCTRAVRDHRHSRAKRAINTA
jgi:hypothetical protein